MKKCKVTLALAAKPKLFYLAPDAETLYLLTTKTIKDNVKRGVKETLKFHPDIEIVTLKHGDWAEIEWNGCQNFHDDGVETIRMNYVKIVRVTKTSTDSPESITVHIGWILAEHLRFVNHRKSGVRVKLLSEKDEQFNFEDLFQGLDVDDGSLQESEVLSSC